MCGMQVLRLICVQCHCNGGFKPKLLDYYKREILQVLYPLILSSIYLNRLHIISHFKVRIIIIKNEDLFSAENFGWFH